ncbi:hypothetical protein WR25_14110 [Diploscapter pachys]|uniref:Ground-like domain-containing protein n=1 Tax=Diploscapter pachys TaxID=2018661 RepID=A0A2A2KLB1_9BILA|nr:hypothetical protein WR25_14110 [Diploscapter pachys]
MRCYAIISIFLQFLPNVESKQNTFELRNNSIVSQSSKYYFDKRNAVGRIAQTLPQYQVNPGNRQINTGKSGDNYAEPPITAYAFNVRKFPLKECFTNPSGYVCCNSELEDEMVNSFREITSNHFNKCNIQYIANTLQRNCQTRFSHPFQVIVGIRDFAQSINFKYDLVCKIEIGGRVLLAYAAPDNSLTGGRKNNLIKL